MNLYFASCEKNGGIFHYKFDKDGRLHLIEKVVCDRPMYLIREGKELHVILRAPFLENEDSGVKSFHVRDDGTLQEENGVVQSTKGKCGCHICKLGTYLYVTNYLSGSIWRSDGIMIEHKGASLNLIRQSSPHPHCIIPTVDKKYLLAADLGTDQVVLYNKNLSEISCLKFSPGVGPRHLIAIGDGRYACVNELACSLSLIEVQETKLLLKQTIDVLDHKQKRDDISAAIRICKNEIYVSNRGSNTISRFLYQGDILRRTDIFPCGGDSPRDFQIIGDWMLCANQNSGTVTILRRDTLTSQWKLQSREEKIPEVLCICF